MSNGRPNDSGSGSAARLGLAIGANRVVAVRVGRAGRGTPALEASLASGPARNGTWPELEAALRWLLEELGLPGARADVALLPPLSQAKCVSVPPVSPAQLDPLLRRNLRRYFVAPFPSPLGRACPTQVRSGKVQRAMAVCADTATISTLCQCAEEAGVRVTSMTAAPVALVEGVRRAVPKRRGRLIALWDAFEWAGALEIVEGVPFNIEDWSGLPTSAKVERADALREAPDDDGRPRHILTLGGPVEEPRPIVYLPPAVDAAEIVEVAAPEVDVLEDDPTPDPAPGDIRVCQWCQAELPTHEHLNFCFECGMDLELLPVDERSEGLEPVVEALAPERATPPPGSGNARGPWGEDPWILAALGAAYRGHQSPSLLPAGRAADLGRAARRRALALWASAAAMLLLTVGIHAYGLTRELATLQAERERIAPEVARALDVRRAAYTLNDQLETLDRIERETPRWTPALAALTEALPQSTYLVSLTTDGTSLSLGAVTRSSETIVPGLEDSPLFQDVTLANVRASTGVAAGGTEFDLSMTLGPERGRASGPSGAQR